MRPGSTRDASSEEPLDYDDVSSPATSSLIDVTPRDPFVGTAFEMPYKSRPLFHLFMTTRVLHSTPVARDKNSFLVHRALSHPGFLHGALLMTTLQWAWSTGDSEQFRVPYLYHKLQAIRFVNEQLANPETAVHEGTIAAVASLALVENSLGSDDAVTSHLRGLARIKEIQDRNGASRSPGLLQRVILMAARCVKSRPVCGILDISRTDDVHQSIIVSILRIALRPIYDIFTLTGSEHLTEELSNVLARQSSHAQALDSNLVALQSVDSSRTGFISCYFYLYMILRESGVDAFVLNWLLEQLLADVCRTESLMHKGSYSQSLWFWTVMFGACATVAARITSPLENEQMSAIRDVYMDKINLASQVLKIKSWEGAKSALRLFAWEDDFDGEEELRRLWEEAVWEDDGHRPKLHSLSSGFPIS
ncbi:hypothetical protein JX265_002541 [Neoarthrinium moseri]|uniref:Uncharacterized protein n=1 Tax=Neoarthrinium moseri TaxID=1658444 RepID=A0A9P9WV34_9PEZI|nr:uncharacterized protein JN550_000355 [Neoarthrinium moseri]KAI1878173.1 hypothetical protein JN550_000355 [Neoarthrinium moseri]KAI1879587.1 hypothetical protein JX265_002541 [Neoarthrinium moseri]